VEDNRRSRVALVPPGRVARGGAVVETEVPRVHVVKARVVERVEPQALVLDLIDHLARRIS